MEEATETFRILPVVFTLFKHIMSLRHIKLLFINIHSRQNFKNTNYICISADDEPQVMPVFYTNCCTTTEYQINVDLSWNLFEVSLSRNLTNSATVSFIGKHNSSRKYKWDGAYFIGFHEDLGLITDKARTCSIYLRVGMFWILILKKYYIKLAFWQFFLW